MSKLLLFTFSVFFLISCTDKEQDVNIQRGLKNDSTIKESQILFAEPQMIDSSHIIIYPLILERTSYGNSYGSSSSGDRTSYWNLIFYNTETAEQHLLTNDNKILIYSINLGTSSSSTNDTWTNNINIFKKNIIYTAVSKDYNSNNQLDDGDPNYLFVSDRDGFNFRQISPDNYNINSWNTIEGTNKIMMFGQKDENGDKNFNSNDKMIPLVVDLTSNKHANETFSSSYVDTLKLKLGKIWKSKKE